MLTVAESAFISWYRQLEPIEQFAVDYFFNSGDDCLMIWLGLFTTYAHILSEVAASQRFENLPFASA